MAMPISSFFSVQTVPCSYNYDLCNYDQGLCWATVVPNNLFKPDSA